MFIDNLKAACKKRGTTPTALLKSMGMSTSSVTAWKEGVTPSVSTVYKIAQKLGCDPADLMEGWEQTNPVDYNVGYVDSVEKVSIDDPNKKAPDLTKKDRRDIAHDITFLMEEMAQGGALMFDGNPLSDEAKESIMAAMKLGLEAAKLKNKERFTPNRQREE